MAQPNLNEAIIERLASAFAPAVAAGTPREIILAELDGTSLADLGPQALARAQDRFIERRHEALHGPLPKAVLVTA